MGNNNLNNEESNMVVSVKNVTMLFNLEKKGQNDLKSFITNLFKKKSDLEHFWALDKVSFNLNKGDRLGILGENGAGKSTLLKIIAGVIKPTGGMVERKGKLVPLLELSGGFDPRYTGRENIYLRGAILGYSKKFIEEKYDEIVEFSEISRFIDVLMENYSSGMKSRLGFAISTIVEPDILILDEVLSVGDAKFKKKSKKRIMSLINKKGTTVLFVSHSIQDVRGICNKAIWLEKGKVVMEGDAEEVCAKYEEHTNK